MSRIDRVFEKLLEICNGEGITTMELATLLNLSRANVSSDLNRLCDEGKAIKIAGKPVLYIVSEKFKKKCKENSKFEEKTDIEQKFCKTTNVLDSFVIKNESLYSAVEQAKAAILYPPHGMNTLILGDTGVGKSMFAGLMYKYAIEMKVFDTSSPFITFNCADYTNNPQLLLSQLFGCKKGAYTGAEYDKVGLIEKANGGILFLDEVHRLPPEGQEMLFTFMDKGIYRRLGDTEIERSAKVLIISATTEDPEKVLLKTFARRIPMFITIPELEKRSLNERFELIGTFIKEECMRINKDIKVSINSIKSLLSYSCPNNIGQLKADIQLVCAKVYADFILKNKSEMKINTFDLPYHIRQGLYVEVEHRQFWSKLIDLNKRYCVFSKEGKEIIFEEYNEEVNIYELVDIRYRELKGRGAKEEELQEAMRLDIDAYFNRYINNFERKLSGSNLDKFIDKEIIEIIEEIIRFSEDSLDINLDKNVYYGMAMHINVSINRIKANKKINNPELNKIRVENPKEFNIDLDCLKIIERALDITMPIDEAGYLTKFFIYNGSNIRVESKKVKVVVIAHGENTATSMVAAVNELIGINYAVGINAPMNEKPEHVLEKLKYYVRENNINDEILLLVDMGSLTTFGKAIEEEFNVNTKVFPLVSTLHVVEAARKASMGYTLNKIFNDLLKVKDAYKYELQEVNFEEDEQIERLKKLAIISICSTGEGVAVEVKNKLNNQLNYDSNLLEIITLRFTDDKSITKELDSLKSNYNIIAIISAFNIKYDTKIFGLEEIVINDGAEKIQKIIDTESIYYKINNTLIENLKSVDGTEVLKDIRIFIQYMQSMLKRELPMNIIIGISLHMACMIDRIKKGGKIEAFEGKEELISSDIELYECIKTETLKLNTKYNININEDEICFIMRFFKKN